MHKSATKCNETFGKWCKNKHGASKIIDTLEMYQFSIDPPYFGYNSVEHETPLLFILTFQRPSGTQIDLGFFWREYFLHEKQPKMQKHERGPPGPKQD
jgi:hypothetical protein